MNEKQKINNKQLIINYLTHSNIMKKFFFLAAIASVALAGCTKNEPVKFETPDAPISFSAIASPNTKAVTGEMPAAYNTSESFIAYAGWTNGDYAPGAVTEFFVNNFTTAICSFDATLGAWKPAQVYYWPKTGKLTFEAVSPADARYHGTISHAWTSGFTITDFEIRGGIKDQYDLLWSNREFNKVRADYNANSAGSPYDDENDSAPNPIYNGVNLLFNHALSSIVFKVKTKEDYTGNNTVITLTGLTIDNADSKGTFSENVTDAVAASYVAPTPSWDNTYAAGDEVTYNIFSGSQVVNAGTAQDLSALVGGASNIILLPQGLAHGAGCHDVTVTVNYTISQNGGSPLAQTSVITLKDLTTGDGATTVAAWEIGKRYTYTIVFALEEIYFDPAVTDWVDVAVDAHEIGY